MVFAVKTKKIILSKEIALAIAVSCVLLFVSEATPQQQEWLVYPVVTRLQGKLTKVTKYGKPSYGETPEKDEKIEVPIFNSPDANPGQGPNNQQR